MLFESGGRNSVTEAKETVSRSIARAWRSLQKTGVAGQVVCLVIVMSIFAIGTRGKYLSWDNLQVILSLAGIPAILAIGLHQTIVLGGIDLSVEGVAGMCIVLVGLLLKNKFNTNNIGLWIVPVVMGAGGIAGLLNGLVITRLRIPSFISTLGLSWILAGIAVYINKATTVPLLDTQIQGIVNGSFLGIPLIALIALGLALLMQSVQDKTRFGGYVYAIGGDEQLAQQAGVHVNRIKIIVFVIAGVFYGLAALALCTQLGSAHPRTGSNILFPAVTAVAVGGVALTGGIGGAKNAALGALIVTALNEGLVIMYVSPYVQQAVNGIVLIAAVALTIDRRKLGFIK